MPRTDSIVIRITGDSGDGIQLVGEQLTITAALTGRDVKTLPDFPAEIRAPAGTVGGVSGFQMAMAEQAIFTAGDEVDVLVALNPAALKQAVPFLSQGGLLILNEDSMQRKDWDKAETNPEWLSSIAEHYQLLTVPITSQTIEALKDLDIGHAQAKKSKNFYVLGLVLWLFELETDACKAFIAKKFKTKPLVADANTKALLAGYNYAMTLELSRRQYTLASVERDKGEYRQITGVEATALAIATVATGTDAPLLVAGYPITPASAVLHECAQLADYGVRLFQAEDEIAAIGACLGAAFGGSLALTCTSGPGLDLKSESLGLAVVSELPLVVLDVQRAGASTGMPTKTGQSDLFLALYGRHGEAPLPILAAATPSDCFTTMMEAFRIAVKYMTPVVVLLDAYLANAAESWKIPEINSVALPSLAFNRSKEPFTRDEHFSRSWNIPGTPGFIHQLGGLEKQGDKGSVSYDPDNHQQMVDMRAKKICQVASDYPALHCEGDVDAEVLLVGWGSTYGTLKAAIAECHQRGVSVALLHLRHLNPLPSDLETLLNKYQRVLVVELNTGQLCQLLRARYLVNAIPVTQCTGQPFTVNALVNAILQEMEHA